MSDNSVQLPKDPSIVDFLKSQGLDASKDKRAEYYARFVDEKETYVLDTRQNLALLRAMIQKQDLLRDIAAEQKSAGPAKSAKLPGDKGDKTPPKPNTPPVASVVAPPADHGAQAPVPADSPERRSWPKTGAPNDAPATTPDQTPDETSAVDGTTERLPRPRPWPKRGSSAAPTQEPVLQHAPVAEQPSVPEEAVVDLPSAESSRRRIWPKTGAPKDQDPVADTTEAPPAQAGEGASQAAVAPVVEPVAQGPAPTLPKRRSWPKQAPANKADVPDPALPVAPEPAATPSAESSRRRVWPKAGTPKDAPAATPAPGQDASVPAENLPKRRAWPKKASVNETPAAPEPEQPVRKPVKAAKPEAAISVQETRHVQLAEHAPERLGNAGEVLLASARKFEGHPFDTLAIPNGDGTYTLQDGEGRYVWQRNGKVTLYDKRASWGNAAAGRPGEGVTFETDIEPIVCIDLLVRAAQDAGLMPRRALSYGDERRVARVEPYLQSLTQTFETIRVPGASYENIASGDFKFPPMKVGDMVFLNKSGHRHSGIVSEVDADGQPTKIYYVNSENKTGEFPLLAEEASADALSTHVPGSGFMFPKNFITSVIRPRSI